MLDHQSMNLVVLVGYVGSTEIKEKVTAVNIATKSRKFSAGNGDEENKPEEISEWHRLAGFGAVGKYMATLQKGDLVSVQGRLVSEEWESDGKKQRSYHIDVTNITTIRRKNSKTE